MLYATEDKLYLKKDTEYAEVVVAMAGSTLSVTETGGSTKSRPRGATPMELHEVVAKYGIEDGVTYPKRGSVTTPSAGATPSAATYSRNKAAVTRKG